MQPIDGDKRSATARDNIRAFERASTFCAFRSRQEDLIHTSHLVKNFLFEKKKLRDFKCLRSLSDSGPNIFVLLRKKVKEKRKTKQNNGRFSGSLKCKGEEEILS